MKEMTLNEVDTDASRDGYLQAKSEAVRFPRSAMNLTLLTFSKLFPSLSFFVQVFIHVLLLSSELRR